MNKNKLVKKSLHVVEQFGLLLILIATIIAVSQEVVNVFQKGEVALKDLLLLFIYLEVIAMIQIYYQEHRLPIRYPLYIAIVALARFIILDAKSFNQWQLLEVGLTIVLLTIAVLIVRYGHVTFPYEECAGEDEKCVENKNRKNSEE